MKQLAVFVATAGYCGYFPFAPGTVGSAAGLVLYAVVRSTGSGAVELVTIAAVLVAGIWSATIAESYFGGIDPGPVVIDEVLGMLVTLAFIPVSWMGALAGFFIFRILDIVKPYPSGRFERLPGGWGVMADDAMAAVYGNLVLRLLNIVWPGWVV